MTRTRTVVLPLPRILVGERSGSARNGGPERLCLLDRVPIPLREASRDEAPEVLRLGEGPSAQSWHAHEGRLYRPLFQGTSRGADPQALAATLAERARDPIPGESCPYPASGETVIDYAAVYRAADHRVGLRAPGEFRMRSVLDEGTAARDAEASRLAATLLLVEDVPMHPAPAPYFLVTPTHMRDRKVLLPVAHAPFAHRFRPFAESVGLGGVRIEPKIETAERHAPWRVFAPWRADEARDFARGLAAMGYADATHAEEAPGFEVLDRPALESAIPDRGLAGYARRASHRFLEISSHELHLRPDATLLALMAHRRDAAAIGDAASAVTAMESLRAYADLLAAEGAPCARNLEARAMLTRYEEYERPRAGLASAYEDGIAALAGLVR